MNENNMIFVTRKDKNGNYLPFENRRKVFISYKKSDNRYRIRDRIISYVLSACDCNFDTKPGRLILKHLAY